jgi:hypothetical protein
MIIDEITVESPLEMALVEDNDVIQALSTNATNDALDIGFCQGLRGAMGRSFIPRLRTRFRKWFP